MTAYLIVDIAIEDPDHFRAYAEQVPTFVARHEGTYLVRGGHAERLEGDWQPERMVVIAFPSAEHARAFLEDPEYAPVAAIRHAAARTRMVLAEGL